MVHFDATVGNNFVECVITYHPRVNFLIILVIFLLTNKQIPVMAESNLNNRTRKRKKN